jgi:hypothetical protein
LKTFYNILERELTFPAHFTHEICDLIDRLLQVDYMIRGTLNG